MVPHEERAVLEAIVVSPREGVDVMHSMSSLDELGIQLPQSPTLNMSKAVVFTDKVVKRMTNGVGILMKGNKNELTADEIIETIHPHPTLSEGLREALLAAEGRPIHIPPRQKARAR